MVGEVTQSIDTRQSKNSNSICYQLAVHTQHVWLYTSLASPTLNARIIRRYISHCIFNNRLIT
jgi:hypothetical protein